MQCPQVLVPKEPRLMGKMVDVDITAATKFSLMSRLTDDAAPVQPAVPEALAKGEISGLVLTPLEPLPAAPALWPWGLALGSAVLLRLAWILWRHGR